MIKCQILVEEERGCGHRKEGGLYLVGTGEAVACDRLPYPLDVCPVCGQGIKQSRGITELDWSALVGGEHENCMDRFICPLCQPIRGELMQLMWVGRRYYTPDSFMEEAHRMGVSKRIGAVPKGIVLGETRVLLAHPDAVRKHIVLWKCELCGDEFEVPELINEEELSMWKRGTVSSARVVDEDGGVYDPLWYRTTDKLTRHEEKHRKRDEANSFIQMEGLLSAPGIFYSFVPQRIEMVISEEQAEDEEFLQKLKARGITPVVVKKKGVKG